MFKHGNLTEAKHPALLAIYIKDEYFHIVSENLVNAAKKEGTNTGLNNIEKRLFFSYGSNATIGHSIDNQNHFKLHLKIPLSQMKVRQPFEDKVEDNYIK